MEGGHPVDFVITTIGPRGAYVQGQCATASVGTSLGVSRFRAVLRKRPGGGQRGVRLVYPSPGGLRVRQPPTRAGTFLTGHLLDLKVTAHCIYVVEYFIQSFMIVFGFFYLHAI